VTTPRQTRLFRVPDLRVFQRAVASLACPTDPFLARSRAVLLPSRGAAAELRHTLEERLLAASPSASGAWARPVADLLIREDWYRQLAERVRTAAPVLNDFEREVLMNACAHEALADGESPPFSLRPGLIVEVVRLYDDLRRLRKTVDAFTRLLVGELESGAESDRGAERLLRQTRFLANVFRRYETNVSALERCDEHGLRAWLLDHPLSEPYTHVVLAVSDRVAERGGLWPADFDLLTRLPLLARIDVIATEALLQAGFFERLQQELPGIEEDSRGLETEDGDLLPPPTLVAPAADDATLYFQSRDREDELSDLVRRLKQSDEDRPSLSRTAVVFKRRLPYIYLAREVFGAAGVPYQTMDALPLAAEPYAAAVDLVFECVSSGFSRGPLVALLRAPHFVFEFEGRPLARHAIDAFDRRLSDAGYLGGLERLGALADQWLACGQERGAPSAHVRRAATVALALARELEPLAGAAPASRHLERLRQFLRTHDRPIPADDPLRERHLRARAAILAAIDSLRDAHRQVDDRTVEIAEIVAAVRRWIEGQTFAPRAGTGGVRLVDAESARFGLFDEVHLVGLIESEWPDRSPRNIFYPPFLLQQQFGWPAEPARLAATRAAFRDLLGLARRRVSLSTFSLEDDAVVGPSVFLEELDRAGLQVVRSGPEHRCRVFPSEAISEEPITGAPLTSRAAAWLSLRQSRTDMSAPQFHGQAGGPGRRSYAVSALETYLECPFKFFAKDVLHLEEEQADEESRRPRVQGLFLHRVFQAFFEEWGRQGRQAITLENIQAARQMFAVVVEPLLNELPEAEATLERNRLFGSAAAEGLAEIVFRIEAEWGADVLERLLEHRLEGEFQIEGPDGPRLVALTGIADRIDLLQDGTLRVIDYKSGRAPSVKRMLQLPIYSVCAGQRLHGRHDRDWDVGDGGYIAFKDARRFVPIGGGNLSQALMDAQARLLLAVDGIEAGRFPPTPIEPFRCTFCSYAGVCRKDYVGDE
jgi:RecB family exonuclease